MGGWLTAYPCVGVRCSFTSQTKRLKEKLVELESAFAALSREAAHAAQPS